jgi:DnaJ-class molecular chaperone
MASIPEAFYQILQLEKDVCDLEAIKQNYRRLARKWHPDKNQSKVAHKEFAAIKKAYDYLIKEVNRNIKKRYAYESLKYQQNDSPKKHKQQSFLVCYECKSHITKSN